MTQCLASARDYVIVMRIALEEELRCELDVPRRTSAADHTERAPTELAVRVGEVRAIEQVEGLDTYLKPTLGAQVKVLKKRQVNCRRARAPHRILQGVAEGADRLRR